MNSLNDFRSLEELIVAGFGGQGVLSLGMTLAYAGMVRDKEISWMPSYGPEMRGGTANCIVMVSENKISSPVVSCFDSAILLSQPAMDKFLPRLKPGGLLLYENDTVHFDGSRNDIRAIGIPALKEAHRLSFSRVMNMILLGSYLYFKPVVDSKAILEALEEVLPEKYHHLIPLNEKALVLGMELAEKATKEPVTA